MIKLGIATIAGGLFALLAFHNIDATVDTQGFLHESFSLLPLGIILLLAGVIIVLVACYRRAASRPSKLS
jgi:uncharacterized integral membrane protein